MKNIFNLAGVVLLCVAMGSTALTSCNDDNDKYDTNQFKGGVSLNAYGPSPVARGGELRFIGSGMDQITKVTLPGSGDITDLRRISSEEIRLTVPQDAEPGIVTLTWAGGTISTVTPLSYTEPILIEDITPGRAKFGQEVTITGQYLNLIHEVCFSFLADSVNVYAKDFVKHERGVIVVNLPEEAVSGPITLSDAAEIPNMIVSEVNLDVVLPSVDAVLDLTDSKGGDQVVVNGSDFDLVRKVCMPDGTEVEFAVTNDDKSIGFTLPDNVSDGAITAIPASGVKVAIANIGVAVPAELVADPADGLRAGQTLTIRGINIEQVSTLSFPNVADPVEPATIDATSLTVEFPAMAQSGDVVLNLRSGKTVSVAVSTAKPEVTGFSPAEASAGSTLALVGRNLDLVTEITFGGGSKITVEGQTADRLGVTVPTDAVSGALTLAMANGENSTTPDLTILLPEVAYPTSVITEELMAGEIMQLTMGNPEKLIGVKVNGELVQYILNGNTLYINLPASCGNGTVITFVSSNGEISYTYDVIPATHVEREIFVGPRDLGNWAGENDGGAFRIEKEKLADVPAGAKLVFHLASYGDVQIQVNDANWSTMEMLEPAQDETTAVFELTAERLNQILTTEDGWSQTGMIIQGKNTIISRVTVEWENSLETVIWEGNWESGNWSGNQDLAWGGYDWASVKAGSVLRLYVTPVVANPDSDWWCVALRHGDGWNMLPAPCPDQWGQPVSGVVELTLETNILDDLKDNGGLVITGADYILTKVTIE